MDQPHNRYNPLKNEWVLVSPQRLMRPWAGKTEKDGNKASFISTENSLLPGATRANGKKNDMYTSTFIFDNDFPALQPFKANCDNSKNQLLKKNLLFKWEPAYGECKVMCFSPDSHLTLATMDLRDIEKVIRHWIKLFKDLLHYDWIQIFENKGEIMGCSNPHPHCQVWASSFIPNEPSIENQTQLDYYFKHNVPLLIDYCKKEINFKERIIEKNDSWVCLVPYWAVWPFETMLIPVRSDVKRFYNLTPREIEDLALVMKRLLTRYDNLFQCSFPYSMGWHGAPTGKYLNNSNINNNDSNNDNATNSCDCDMKHWTFHAHYYPPLLRSETVKKFMVGYELLAQPQRDLTAEKAAQLLREQSADVHYTLNHAPKNLTMNLLV